MFPPPTSNDRIRATRGIRYPAMAGLRCASEWLIDGGVHYFVFEARRDAVRALVPEPLTPVELRPGVCAVSFSFSRMAAGNLDGRLPSFVESLFCVLIQPDLSLDMPVPRFAFHVVRAAADSATFLANETRSLKLQTMTLPTLAEELDQETPAVALADESGPLFLLRNTQPGLAPWPLDQWGQFTTLKDGVLYRGLYQFDGLGIEHQQPGDAGRAFDHPFYEGLRMERDLGDCFLQLVGRKGHDVVQRFFEPRAIAEVR